MTAVVKWAFEDYWRSVEQKLTFQFSGSVQTFTVPDTVTSLYVELRGGTGGGDAGQQNQTSGGYVSGWLPVTPGEVLSLYVGGDGAAPTDYHGAAGGWNGGGNGGNVVSGNLPGSGTPRLGGYGGGGATDIRQGGTALQNRTVIAAGSGGASGFQHLGGAGGTNTGASGWSFPGYTFAGAGGTQTAGGAAFASGFAGSLGVGGAGADNQVTIHHSGAGGGGGGYYGGGGGGAASRSGIDDSLDQWAFGGGGGSNYVGGLDNSMAIVNQKGALFSTLASKPFAYISIAYTQEPLVYTMAINPNDNGAVNVQKNILMSQSTGPNRVNILQEGQSQAPLLDFSGIILSQDQLEAMEYWYDRRVFMKVTDDLGREYYGVFSKFVPKRARRASNFWYHTYDAEFTLSAYKNASGSWVYGRML